MDCVVVMNAEMIGENFLCQKHDPPSKRKKTMKDCLFLIKFSKPCRKKIKNRMNTHRKNTELASLTVRGKHVQTCFHSSESKLFSLKQVFVLARQVFIDHF